MTREEAIRHIRDLIAENNSIAPNMTVFEQEKEALYMAIEALTEPKTIIGIDIPYGSDKGIATVFKGNEKMVLEEVKEIMSVVRCKDCEHRYWDKTSEFWTCYHTMDLAIDDNDFCSLARMKGGAE